MLLFVFLFEYSQHFHCRLQPTLTMREIVSLLFEKLVRPKHTFFQKPKTKKSRIDLYTHFLLTLHRLFQTLTRRLITASS